MKTTNKLSKWCKNTLMLLPVVAMLTFMSCQKDDLLSGASPETAALAKARIAGTYLIDFEDPDVLNYLAGPTSYGENLYDSYTGADRYYGYYDAATGLYMMINEDPYYPEQYNFWGGGIAISQWNDTITPCYINQCSVYHIDPVTGKGGYDGSNTFAVAFGYKDTSSYGEDTRSHITFYNPEITATFNGFYVTNSTYAVRSMEHGDECDTTFATRPLDNAHQDWFKLIVEGLDANNEVAGTVEFYLADFRTPTSPGIIKDWEYVDLSPLGAVNALRLNVEGSYHNAYGLVTPAYFCFDNLSVTIN
jgi:hypothetical protein